MRKLICIAAILLALPVLGQSIFDDWPGATPKKPPTKPPTSSPATAPAPAPTPTPATPTPTPTPATPGTPAATEPATPATPATGPATPGTPGTPGAPTGLFDNEPRGPKKEPEPAAAAQKEAEKQIREVFAAEYAKPAQADKQTLAKKLMQHALETKDSPVTRYVLFREARDLAAAAGDARTAIEAVGELDDVFAIDAGEMKLNVMMTVARSARGAEANRTLAEACLAAIEDLVRSDQFDKASRVAFIAEPAARASGDAAFAQQVSARSKEIANLQREDRIVRDHRKTLTTKPEDAEANLAVGRFLLVVKKDADKAMPMLAKGSDASLKEIAAKEMLKPTVADEQMALGDAWWDYGQTDKTMWKNQYQARAAAWYEKAMPRLTGINKAKVQKRLDDLENAAGEVDLLKLIDLNKDAQRGTWKFDGMRLLCATTNTTSSTVTSTGRVRYASSGYALVAIPYVPPEEYDMTVVAERTWGLDELQIGLVGGGHQFSAVLCGDRGTTNGLGCINGIYPYLGLYGRTYYSTDPLTGNPTVYRYWGLKARQVQTVGIQVRQKSVTVRLDGVTLVNWKADYSKVSLDSYWTTPQHDQLSIGCGYNTSFAIHKMTLKPVTGRGKKLRPNGQ